MNDLDETTKMMSRLMYKLIEEHESSIGTTLGHRALVASHITGFMSLINQEQLALLERLKKQPVELSDSGSYVWAVPLEVINQEEARIRGKK